MVVLFLMFNFASMCSSLEQTQIGTTTGVFLLVRWQLADHLSVYHHLVETGAHMI